MTKADTLRGIDRGRAWWCDTDIRYLCVLPTFFRRPDPDIEQRLYSYPRRGVVLRWSIDMLVCSARPVPRSEPWLRWARPSDLAVLYLG